MKDVTRGSLTTLDGGHATIATFTTQAKGDAPRAALAMGWTASNGDARVAFARPADVTALLARP